MKVTKAVKIRIDYHKAHSKNLPARVVSRWEIIEKNH